MSYQALPSAAAYYMSNPGSLGAHGIADGPGAFMTGISPNYLGGSLSSRRVQFYSNVGPGRATAQGVAIPARIGPLGAMIPAFTSTTPY